MDVWDGSPPDVQRYFVNTTKATYPILTRGSGVGSQYGLDRSTFVIVDHEGLISYVSQGQIDQRYNESALTSTIRTLLQRGPADDVAQAASDFDGDGVVGFEDFFLFSGAFGGRDARFDLDKSGAVGFEDFFLFAADFGKKARR